jgi:hypothetical protein
MDDFVLYPKRTKLLLLAAGALMFVVLGIYLAQNQESMGVSLWKVIIASYVGVPFSSLCFVYAIYRLVNHKPAVVVNHEGIFDNASAAGAGLLRWEEIANIFPYDYMGQRMLGINLVDEAAILARQPAIKRALARMNKKIAAPFNIPQNTLPISVDELLVEIKKRQPHVS